VIVVIGPLHLLDAAPGHGDDSPRPGLVGLAVAIAAGAAAEGATVEFITKIGDDPDGDAAMLALARNGVGHVAVLRDPAFATGVRPADAGADAAPPDGPPPPVAPAPVLDAADVGLALRYLSDYRVLAVVHPASPGILDEAIAAAGWASAHLIVVTDSGAAPRDDLPADALVIGVDADEERHGVGRLLGHYAAAIDRGDDRAAAFAAFTAEAAAATWL
jgi:hypothetical protein